MYKVGQFYEDCRNECDIEHLGICKQVACNSHDRLYNNSVAFKLLGRIDTPYDRD